ncbi:uncharacterized protein ACJ7VT_020011 isoform 2-T2 [Polymixia lowei]
MSAVMSWRGEGGIVTALHLQCPLCGHFSKSHAHLLIHMANTHPTQLDHMTVGRLGNAVIYQSTARLFHCSDCFFTTREFTKLYDHLITTHCMEEGGGGEEHSLKRKRSEEEAEGERKDEGNPSDQQTSVSKTGGDEGVAEGVAEGRGEGVAEGVAEGRGEGVAEDVAEGRGEGVAEDGVKGAVLVFDGSVYRCLTCGWKHKLKALGINHLVRKHDIPKAYANLAVRQSPAPSATPKPPHAKPSEEEEEEEQQRSASTNLLREEMEATAKVIHFTANRFICRICGWKTKLKVSLQVLPSVTWYGHTPSSVPTSVSSVVCPSSCPVTCSSTGPPSTGPDVMDVPTVASGRPT